MPESGDQCGRIQCHFCVGYIQESEFIGLRSRIQSGNRCAGLSMQMDTPEVVSTVAAIVSAIGGAFAALAAFRSADSARVAQQAAVAAELRAALRQIGTTATEMLIEAERIASRGNDLKIA